ncbi:uncharacterized protein LOC133521004 [Cydia pomonella]|uniref:uncharacterized protein LOC133521004 n=1 Tax=Cydia pomonella TaxID=82600 RepID=UPI002ADE76BB|nr:uncharacterized protein LOC133521004 [Cydia pomonella]
MLGGEPLKIAKQFKYLGHMLTEELNDDFDLERERRALAVRGNMLARSLWVSFTQRYYNTLRVQYNNSLRMLLRLPKHCSASGMFAEARADDFFAIRRKRIASMLKRVRGSSNCMLRVLAERLDCPLTKYWVDVVIGRTK